MTKEILIDQLVERGGISYEVNSTTPFAGVTLDYDENGQLQQRSNYKDGKLEGLFEWFDEDGNLTKTEEYKDGELIE